MKIKLQAKDGTEERRLVLEGANELDPPRVIIDRNKAFLLIQKGDWEGYMVYGGVSAVLLDTMTGE